MAVTVGERRIVSVLIADVVGSTGIGETLGPERSKILLDEVVRLMSEQVRRYDGTVAQLAGDQILALFGAPVAHEDDSERAVRAALAIQRALGQYGDEVGAAYGIELAVRVAVNTGPIVMPGGIDGDDGYDRWNALGDTVNVAARLEKLADEGGVLVASTTARQIEGGFELEPVGDTDLRGRTSPVPIFRVTGIRDGESIQPIRPLVGREFELTVLERAVDALIEGRGTIVSVMGEPGIGKTRLVVEVRERYRDRVRFVEGRAVSYAQSFPYWPVRDLLREWLGVGASTPEARVRVELRAELVHLFGDEADDVYPFLASVLGLTLEPDMAERMRELNRESIQHQTFEAFSELVCRIGTETPLCVVFEDLHWADESTLELLEHLLRVTEESSVALFFLYRTEREHGSWQLGERARRQFPHRYREIELRPLPADAIRALAAATADGDVPESVAELLAERAGGNPFFLEEALRDLIERGVLQRQNGEWQLAVGLDEISVPALVQGALQARLDRLDPKSRELLNVAAVVGRTFGVDLLERIVPHGDLVPALSELQRLDLIVERRRRPKPEYRFRHGLVQEVAYAALVEPVRRRLHSTVGEALEQIYLESPEEAYGLLARHFSEADEAEKAVEYLLKAGDAARAIYADDEALHHYRKARAFLARLGDERRARDTLFKMALAYHVAFRFAEAEELYDEAFCCRVEEPAQLEPAERLEVLAPPPEDVAPRDVYSTESMLFTEHVFRGLLMVDGELNVIPAIADNLRVSSDGLEYLFRLREGVRWSDGEPLTAEDFTFAWRRIFEEETITAFMMEDVESAQALDERTIEVRLHEPRSYFPYILTSPWSFPWPRHKCEELGDDWRRPENLVGNGPFMLGEFDEEHALLVPNPYWNGPRGNISELLITFGHRGPETAEEWRRGRFDVMQTLDPTLREAPDTLADAIPELSTGFIGFRADREPFSNGLVRRAFAHGIDRELLMAGHPDRPATRGGAIPPAMPGHSHRVGLAYDLEIARALLADAGYPNGRGLPELTMVIPRWFAQTDKLEELFEALGARVTFARKSAMDVPRIGAHLFISGWTADYPDPDGFFRGLLRKWPVFRDEAITELLTAAQSSQDQGERMRYFHDLDRLWVSELAAVVPISYGRSVLLRRPWVDGLWTNPLSRVSFDRAVVSRSGPRSA